MSLSDIVNVSITKATASVDRASFGIPLIASYHTKWSDRIRTYDAATMLATLVTETFATTDPTYLAAQALLSQKPRPSKIKVGRRDQTWTMTVDLTPVAANTTVYNGTVNGLAWTFTSDGTATLAEVCTGIAAAIEALAGVTATGASGTKVVISADAAGTLFDVVKGTGAGVYTFADVTVGTGVATDLATLRAADKNWYGLVLDTTGAPAVAAAAAWAEADRVIFVPTTADSETLNPASTTDTGYTLDASAYARTALFYHPSYKSFFGAGLMGVIFPKDPGSATWKFKTAAGVSGYEISETAKGALKDKHVNYYDDMGGTYRLTEGVTSSGEFIDITQSIDWLQATIGEDVFAAVAAPDKLSYEDSSVDVIRSVTAGVLSRAVARKVLAKDPAPTVTAPRVADVSEVDRDARYLPGVKFAARMAGAIHKVDIQGTVTV